MKKSILKIALLAMSFLCLNSCGSVEGSIGPQGEQGIQGEKGDTGNGISSIVKTGTNGNIDTYTITYTDGTTSTFTVTNGVNGVQGIQGLPGEDGHTPVIIIGENGNWIIDGKDTGVKAQGEQGIQGEAGKDGTSLLTGNGDPSSELGKEGDSYIDLDTWDFFVKEGNVWVNKGNIKGKDYTPAPDHNGTEGLEFYPINETECAVVVGRAKLLNEIVIPSTYKEFKVTSIMDGGFESCENLKKITIPESLISIGYDAFRNCSSLTSITIPSSVTSIGDYAFYNCGSLETVTIEEGSQLTSIGDQAFYNCSSLISITIPSSVTSIGDGAFHNCSSLTSITIPNSVTSIGSNAFSNCSSLEYNEYDNTYYLGNSENPYLVLVKAKDTSITSYVFIEDTRFIMNIAFDGCSSLTSITIPNSVTSIGGGVFYNCSSLEIVIFEEGSQLTSIGDQAFFGCSSLASITIPSSVTSIGISAFSDCSSLETVTIEGGSQMTSIGEYAFAFSSSLTSITIPSSVTSIGGDAFYCCRSLTIYCEAESRPSGWNSKWNSSNCSVVWGYEGE